MNNKLTKILFLLITTIMIQAREDKMQNFYDFKAKSITGEEIVMSSYKGKVVVVVNVASKCLYTRQYEGLQKIYENTRIRGWKSWPFLPISLMNRNLELLKRFRVFVKSIMV